MPGDIQITNSPKDRIKSILNNTPAIFEITIDGKSTSDAPWYENKALAEKIVLKNTKIIEKISKEHKVDSDLIKSIMWAENARGSWGGLGYTADKLGISSTIMPMNINPEIWHKLVNAKKEDFHKVETNIEASAILLRRIKTRIIQPTPEKIAAIWQYIGQEKTNNYASYVGRIYKEKTWKQVKKD